MDFKELKKKKESDLHKILAESRDKLRDLRFKDANKQLKNVREIRTVRETIARVLTLLNSEFRKQKTESRKQTHLR
ncbi:50S ribosomal protein L29 [Candidatus Parcubacteria bacterium]|nr:50S ribosomal protein L29 [Candidatus Parcubacteria bacterium]